MKDEEESRCFDTPIDELDNEARRYFTMACRVELVDFN